MARSTQIRSLARVALITVSVISIVTGVGSADVRTDLVEARVADASSQPSHIRLTPDQMALAEFAVGRFEAQGLSVPDVEFEFFPSTIDCQGHKGFYVHSSRTLRMCSMDKATLLHELAHAWANDNLDEQRRAEFATFRGLEAWNDQDLAWQDRGTEHAAEIIAWALLDEPTHVKWVEDSPHGGQSVEYRLLSIENSDVESMLAAFQFLTGADPIFRDVSEWDETTSTAASPEARRSNSAAEVSRR